VILGAIILLITAELVSPHYGLRNLTINKKKLTHVANTMVILFLVIEAFRIISIFTSP